MADVTNGKAPLSVNLTASGSSDPDGDALTYAWDFGDGSAASAISTTHIYTNPGNYIVSVTVSDGLVNDTATIDIKVRKGDGKK